MNILSLEDLLQPDGRTLRFAPGGLLTGAALTPESAARFQQEIVAGADLVDAVPEPVRASFERLRRCHSLGVVWYEAFTVASDLSYVVLEFALRERFVEFYAGVIPLLGPGDVRQDKEVRDFAEFAEFVRACGKKPPKLVIGQGASHMPMPLTLNPLLVWARREGLLGGQRNRHIEGVLSEIRNGFAHGSYRTGMPGESARDIRDLAEIVNRLWGHLTPGGRLHPAPLAREAVVIGWKGDDAVQEFVRFSGEQLGWGAGDEGEPWTYLVLLAVPKDDYLLNFDSRAEQTSYPAELLWGPGTYAGAKAWWATSMPGPDAVTYLDRLFAVQVVDGKAQPPRSGSAAMALPEQERGGTWHVVRADYPVDAQMHVAHGLGSAQAGPCHCAVEQVTSGLWASVVESLTATSQKPRVAVVARVPGFGEPTAGRDEGMS